jgi:large subunit ribosomal protein L25
MVEKIVIEGKVREETGKGTARKLRAEGKVPAVVYGGGEAPLHIYVRRHDVHKLIHLETTIMDLMIEGKSAATPVIIRDYALDPITDEVIHVDFQRVKMDEEISAMVPVVLLNEDKCIGVKMGGIIQHGLREVEVECLPKDLPAHIEVDISQLEIGDTIKVADLQVPAGVKVAEDPEEVIVTLVPLAVYEEVAVAEEVSASEVPTVAETMKQEEKD